MAQQIEGCHKAKAAGFAMSVTAILGIGGEERTHEHAVGTGKALSAIDPEYIGILSLMLESGTEMTEAVRSGRFVVPEPLDLLRELREIIANIDVTHAVFRSNHASNYLALRGTLPERQGRPCSKPWTGSSRWGARRGSSRRAGGRCRGERRSKAASLRPSPPQ